MKALKAQRFSGNYVSIKGEKNKIKKAFRPSLLKSILGIAEKLQIQKVDCQRKQIQILRRNCVIITTLE